MCALAVAAGTSASAHPPAPVGPRGEPVAGAIHAWLHQAKVPLVRGRIQVLIGDCPGRPAFVGCVFSSRPRRIYLSRRARDPRGVLYHELGHVFDLTTMRSAHRRRFRRIVHRRGGRWFGARAVGEWFADGYAACARGRRPRGRTAYGYAPTARQHRAVCRLIREAGAPPPRRRRKQPPPQPPPAPPPVIVEEQAPQPPPGGGEAPAPPPESEPPPGSCDVIERILTGCRPGI